MNYIIAILMILLVLKIIELEKRISHLEGHDPLSQHRSVLVTHPNNLNDFGSRVYVINDEMLKRK
ncbi:MAG: hypothetical protein PHR77_06325 [Kiritimatiellae bacterium]|nr:hypothetical protein [Kiritimatiellia bacterium]MDD5521524.1 hypothetical protein [Kiritimatiellia bacterium]